MARNVLVVFCLAAAACSASDDISPHVFSSDVPRQLAEREDWPIEDDDGEEADDALLEIERMRSGSELSRLEDDRLYVLSPDSGLHVFGVSPAGLRTLGSFDPARDARPLRMYLQDGVVFVLYTGWGQHERDASGKGYAWVQMSNLVVLDASDPAHIEPLTSFSIPGVVTDTRLVSNVLYAVAYQDGECWACASEPVTALLSLDVSDPSDVRVIDELRYADEAGWSGAPRAVHLGDRRAYVAGLTRGPDGPIGSSIQVVELGLGSGALDERALLEADGQIGSAWQMDEHEGVLRVVSQPSPWDPREAPVVQTFAIAPPGGFAPLGRTRLSMPEGERVQRVQFDGPRAYALSFEPTASLFAIDLEDPARPVQRALDVPGFVYAVAPLGERAIVFGFDPSRRPGGPHASLMDVSDLEHPVVSSQVGFDGMPVSLLDLWQGLQPSVLSLDGQSLIAMPLRSSAHACARDGQSIQLIDYDPEAGALAVRGALLGPTEARRVFSLGERLFVLDAERIDEYEIGRRAAPRLIGRAAFARNVTHVVPLASGAIARFSEDLWNARWLRVDFVRVDDVARAEAGEGELDLSELLRASSAGCEPYLWIEETFAIGDTLAVVYRSEPSGDDTGRGVAGLALIDARDPRRPALLSDTRWDIDYATTWSQTTPGPGVPAAGGPIVHTERAVVMLESSETSDPPERWLRIVDVRDARRPVMRVMRLPTHAAYGGLLVDRDTVLMSYSESVQDDGATRFFVERVELADPAAPRSLASINVPGVLLHYDSDAERAVTVDTQRLPAQRASKVECAQRFSTFEFIAEPGSEEDGVCTGYRQRLHLLRVGSHRAELLDSYALPEAQALRSSAIGTDTLFATVGRGTYRGAEDAECGGRTCAYEVLDASAFLALSGLAAGELVAAELQEEDAWWGWSAATTIHAFGRYALVLGHDDALIIDATDASTPRVQRRELMPGSVHHVSKTAAEAFLSFGPHGGRGLKVGAVEP